MQEISENSARVAKLDEAAKDERWSMVRNGKVNTHSELRDTFQSSVS
jgi:hypothetical protein